MNVSDCRLLAFLVVATSWCSLLITLLFVFPPLFPHTCGLIFVLFELSLTSFFIYYLLITGLPNLLWNSTRKNDGCASSLCCRHSLNNLLTAKLWNSLGGIVVMMGHSNCGRLQLILRRGWVISISKFNTCILSKQE